MGRLATDLYTSGEYKVKNAGWHAEDSRWKAEKILAMLGKNRLCPRSICEIGCGTGGILAALQGKMGTNCVFTGYEISPQAYQLCLENENSRLRFHCEDFLATDESKGYDIILLIDLIEHLEDYFCFLRAVKARGKFKILHVPLDMNAQWVLREMQARAWDEVGHLHSFTKQLVLKTLEFCGYDVLDYRYTAGSIDLPSKSLRNFLAKFPRRALFSLSPDLAQRALGGWSLLVLAE